jgi:hypothetical protein
MQKNNRFLLLALLALTMPLAYVNQANAIPAFSREHNTECTTCHTIYPELNEYGEAFLKNGYVWTKNREATEKPKAKPAPAKMKMDVKGEGDPELLDKLKANALGGEAEELAAPEQQAPKKNEPLWLAGLPEKLPLALSATLNVAYDRNAFDHDELDFSTRALSLLAAGVFRERIGFWVKYDLFTQGVFDPAQSNTPLNNTPDIEEVFFVWRKALDTPFNLKVGRLRPKLSLWKKENKTTVSDFATNVFTVGNSRFTLDAPEDAVEVNAVLGNRMFVAGGVVDRNGQNTKEGYGHVSFKIGGSDFLGKEPEVDLDHESVWDYLSITVGGYSYFGRNSGDSSTQRNNFYRAGGDLDLLYKSLRFRFAGLLGKDNNPDFGSSVETDSVVFAGQAEYMFAVNLLGLFRYEHQEVGNDLVRRYIPAIAYAPIENTKVTLEYQHAMGNGNAVDRRTLLGLRFTF